MNSENQSKRSPYGKIFVSLKGVKVQFKSNLSPFRGDIYYESD